MNVRLKLKSIRPFKKISANNNINEKGKCQTPSKKHRTAKHTKKIGGGGEPRKEVEVEAIERPAGLNRKLGAVKATLKHGHEAGEKGHSPKRGFSVQNRDRRGYSPDPLKKEVRGS